MAYNSYISLFPSFSEVDPSCQRRCIFPTQQRRRCSCDCRRDDNDEAIDLYKRITSLSAEDVSLELIQEYILKNCCRRGRAPHQMRVENVGLLEPLAEQWLHQIAEHAAKQWTDSQEDAFPSCQNNTIQARATTPTCFDTPYTLSPSPSGVSLNAESSDALAPGDQEPFTPPLSPESSSTASPNTTHQITEPLAIEPRYHLRPRNRASPRPPSQSPPPEFLPHKSKPGQNDSVSAKLMREVKGYDKKNGYVYIYERSSSPGYVKIGWTSTSVPGRLEDWSKSCGYRPILLFETENIPNARRVETLTHFELLKEWRRERMCKGANCLNSHQEWFETTKEKAAQVVGGWAEFFKTANPYDERTGSLKAMWKNVVKMMNMRGEAVTAATLWRHYETWLASQETVVKETLNSENVVKAEEIESKICPTLEYCEDFEETTLLHHSSPRIEQPILVHNTESNLSLEAGQVQKESGIKKEPISEGSLSPSPRVNVEPPSEQATLLSSPIPRSSGFGKDLVGHPKSESVPDLSATLITEISDALLSLDADEQECLAKCLGSIAEGQQNQEGEGHVQAKRETEMLVSDEETNEEKTKLPNDDEQEAPVDVSDGRVENMNPADADLEATDLEATLIDDVIPAVLEKVAEKASSVLCSETPSTNAVQTLESLGDIKRLDSGPQVAIPVMA